MPAEDFKAGEQPWDTPHLPAQEQLLRGLQRGACFWLPERKRLPGTNRFPATLKNGVICKTCMSAIWARTGHMHFFRPL